MYCSNCGKEIEEESKYCKYCGCDLKNDSSKQKNKDNIDTIKEDDEKEFVNYNHDNNEDTIDSKNKKKLKKIFSEIVNVILLIVIITFLVFIYSKLGLPFNISKIRDFFALIISLGISLPLFFLLVLLFIFLEERSSEYSKCYTEYPMEKKIKDYDEETLINLAKETIIRKEILLGDIKWERAKVLEKDIYDKNLIYIECKSQNAFGTYISSALIICIKINEDNTYLYRREPTCFFINKVDNLENFVIDKSYKKAFKWDKEILDEDDWNSKYQIKNFISWTKSYFHRLNNIIKKIIEIIKTNRIVDAVLIIMCCIIVVNIIKNIPIVEVPKLEGMTVAEAQSFISDRHLTLDVESRGSSSEIIIYQSVNSGDKVKLNEQVTVKTDKYKEWEDKPAYSTVEDAAKQLISYTLKSPSTAKWGNYCQVVDEDNYGRYLVYISVEAQNGFGAYIQSAYMVVLQSVDKYGKFSYNYNYYIKSSSVSEFFDPVESYKNGNISSDLKLLLNSNNWNQEQIKENN